MESYDSEFWQFTKFLTFLSTSDSQARWTFICINLFNHKVAAWEIDCWTTAKCYVELFFWSSFYVKKIFLAVSGYRVSYARNTVDEFLKPQSATGAKLLIKTLIAEVNHWILKDYKNGPEIIYYLLDFRAIADYQTTNIGGKTDESNVFVFRKRQAEKTTCLEVDRKFWVKGCATKFSWTSIDVKKGGFSRIVCCFHVMHAKTKIDTNLLTKSSTRNRSLTATLMEEKRWKIFGRKFFWSSKILNVLSSFLHSARRKEQI